MEQQGDISVSKKTLVHISEGIYRTAGSALKELINNAFDANANRVIINTNFPQFDTLSCKDDGDGMTKDEFLRIVQGGIGDSPKASQTQYEGRPIIGKLGIGILAVAQVCRSFTIISHHAKSKTAFKGRMIFRTDVDKETKKNIQPNESLEIGKWILEEEIPYNPNKKGVLVFTSDLRLSISKLFKDSVHFQEKNSNITSLEFEKLLSTFYENDCRMIKELGPYHELIWELCNLLPLPYFKGSPVRKEYQKSIDLFDNNKSSLNFKNGIEFLTYKQKQLEGYKFEVIFDDIKLYRPIYLPFPIQRFDGYQESQLFYFEYDQIVRKRQLKFFGYIIAQEIAIKPRDLKGIQIRIKNVGIGNHDFTFLKYDKIESPRDNWLSGEIYVDEGLESALNIDRDSFNENDEHYFMLKATLHKFLHDTVYPKVSSAQRSRNQQKRNLKTSAWVVWYKSYLTEQFEGLFPKYNITYSEKVDQIDFDEKKKIIFIPEKLITAKWDIRMNIFSLSIRNLLDGIGLITKDVKKVDTMFKVLSESILNP